VLVCSTGLIGIPLPMEPIEAGIPKLVAALSSDRDGAEAAADAMLTTDTVRKETVTPMPALGAVVGGMAKGAAMLAPSMATMLAVLTTDAAVGSGELHEALRGAVDDSFNSLIVDGCTSTNDTVLVLANGEQTETVAAADLVPVLGAACADLAEQMAADAEGATKRARVIVRGARTRDDARRAARSVAASQLVQCSLNGGDPYWGRVLSELGASGATFDPEHVTIAYNGIVVCRDGVAAAHDVGELARIMAAAEIDIECDLQAGSESAVVLCTDLSHAYIDENRRTS
jgi:glutamate N-acetyltransferase/amino-acid N-acetyltransferase